jgi:hypothetical protein
VPRLTSRGIEEAVEARFQAELQTRLLQPEVQSALDRIRADCAELSEAQRQALDGPARFGAGLFQEERALCSEHGVAVFLYEAPDGSVEIVKTLTKEADNAIQAARPIVVDSNGTFAIKLDPRVPKAQRMQELSLWNDWLDKLRSAEPCRQHPKRVLETLAMLRDYARGRTWEEIAQTFGVDRRTPERRVHKLLRERGLSLDEILPSLVERPDADCDRCPRRTFTALCEDCPWPEFLNSRSLNP